MSPSPGSRPLQVSQGFGIRAASSPARSSGPGSAPAAAAAAPRPLRVSAPPRGGSALRSPGQAAGTRRSSGGWGPASKASEGPQAALARELRRAPPAGWEKGRRPLAHPHSHIAVSSSIPVPSTATRPANAAYLGLRQVQGSGPKIPPGPAPGRRMLCPAPLSPTRRSAPPLAPPSSRRFSSSALVSGPLAGAAVTQRGGNGCGEGLPVCPTTRPVPPRPATLPSAPGQPAALLWGRRRRGGLVPSLPMPGTTPAAVSGQKLWAPMGSDIISKCLFMYLIFIEHLLFPSSVPGAGYALVYKRRGP